MLYYMANNNTAVWRIIYALFNEYILASNYSMINELEWIWKEAVVN
jgi:hypothetical protein